MEDESNDTETQSKITRLIRKYDFDGIGENLERMWLGDGVERHSLRDLATHFNHQIVQAAMREAGLNPIDGEAENTYRLLTADDTTSGTRMRVGRRLEREGIDVEELQNDFVSHQAIHTYLTDVRGAEHAKSDTDPVESGIDTIQSLQGRVTTVSKNTVENLNSAEHVSIGDFDVVVNTQVVCRDCGTQYDITDFLRRGHCDCEQS